LRFEEILNNRRVFDETLIGVLFYRYLNSTETDGKQTMLVERKSDAKNRTKEKQRSLKTKLKPGFQFLSFTCVRRPVCVCECVCVCVCVCVKTQKEKSKFMIRQQQRWYGSRNRPLAF
jgi:hypothetical protein